MIIIKQETSLLARLKEHKDRDNPRKRRQDARDRRRRLNAATQAKQELLRTQEIERRAEAIAPAAQRLPIMVDGEVYKHPRLEQFGITYIVSNPIRRLCELGQTRRTDRGLEPLFNKEIDEPAAERLVQAWNEGGQGMGLGASDYEGQGIRGGSYAGFSDEMLARLDRQRKQRDLCSGAQRYLGVALWRCVHRVIIDGISPTAWSREARMQPEHALGYLRAGLDQLIDYWREIDKDRKDNERQNEQRTRIRSAQIEPRGVD